MFYNGEFSAPWSFRSPPSCNVAPLVAAGAKHVIIYHLLTEGHASARVEDGERLGLDAGDVVIFPHGDPHIIENGRPIKTVDLSQHSQRCFGPMVGKLDPLFRRPSGRFPGWGRGRSGKAVGGLVCRNTAGVHCAPATGTYWLVGRRPRSGGRKNACVDAPQSCPSVDNWHYRS